MRLVFSSIRLYRRIRSMHSSASFTKPGAAVGNCGSGDMENSCSSGTRGPNPLLIFFNEMCSKQRSSADKRAQRIADHVVHLRHAKRIAVLRIFDSRTEHTTNKRRENNSAPAPPTSTAAHWKASAPAERRETRSSAAPDKAPAAAVPRRGRGGTLHVPYRYMPAYTARR